MDMLRQWNRFFEIAEAEDLNASDQLVYVHLLNKYNRLYRKDWFGFSTRDLENRTKLSNMTIRSAKNRLKQKGLIDFQNKGKSTTLFWVVDLTVPRISTGTSTDVSIDTSTDVSTATSTGTSTGTSTFIRVEKENKSINDVARAREVQPFDLSEGLNPAIKAARDAFQSKLRWLVNSDDVATLDAYVGDYGCKAVIAAIEQAAKARPNNIQRLPVKYLLPILQRGGLSEARQEEPVRGWKPPLTAAEIEARDEADRRLLEQIEAAKRARA